MLQIQEFTRMDSCSLRNVVSILLIFLCLGSVCSGLPYGTRSLEDQQSRRLDRLKLMSERLALKSRINRSSRPANPSSRTDSFLAILNRDEYLKLRDQRRRSAVVKRSSAMDQFKETFSGFHDELTKFVDKLILEYKPDTPDGLLKATVLPKILTPNDPNFSGTDDQVKTAMTRLFIQETLLQEIFRLTGSFVVDDSHKWFTDTEGILNYYLILLKLYAGSVSVTGSASEILSSGVGGLNTDVQSSMGAKTLSDLSILLNTLKQISST